MSRTPDSQVPEEPERYDDREGGSLEPTPLGVVFGWGVAGLVGGWLLHPLFEQVSGAAPVISWFQPLALLLVAVVVGYTAWQTWRAVQVRREHLEPHRAVNRLALGRAAALAGALVAGGYLGYALSWVGNDAELAGQRIVRALVAAGFAVLTVVGGLVLERACRISSGRREP